MAGVAWTAAVRATPLAVVAFIGVLSVGCSGNPATPGGSGTTTGSRTSLAVPAVPSPLDVEAFRDRPCDLISEQQAGDLGLPLAQEDGTGGYVACKWRADSNDPRSLEALSVRVQESGLDSIAQQCKGRSDCDTWIVDTIADYPVIRANGQLESKYGFCRLFVGVADDVAFMVTDGDRDSIGKGVAEGDAGGPRCDRADRAATMVIHTLRAGR